ncbi:SKA complex subunit 2 isoform X2 [Archocentrus centrarchus]|uniref:SKA complex subunit 2 isoform X2 n=1 Tax=Archocentrus centrarchus TaxID=63155 RepID=UPI0011EA2223|nr:spindle and kinetochore-associated protein 2 isoform X2 [Archocentrus centrarchus]
MSNRLSPFLTAGQSQRPHSGRKLFNMETTVEKLEAMFLKAEADLDYIEKRMKLDFITNAAENGCPAENPAMMLENLKTIKSKHSALCSQVKELTNAQKDTMDSIRNNLSSVMELIQHFEQTTDVEVETLTQSEQESAALLSAPVSHTTAEVPSAVAASDQEQPQSGECEKLTAAMLETVPHSIRSNIKLADLNTFYEQLQQHLGKSNRGSLSVQKMQQLKMNVSDAKLKILQHLSVVELDRKGHVRLVV